jgi:hypothetical protein
MAPTQKKSFSLLEPRIIISSPQHPAVIDLATIRDQPFHSRDPTTTKIFGFVMATTTRSLQFYSTMMRRPREQSAATSKEVMQELDRQQIPSSCGKNMQTYSSSLTSTDSTAVTMLPSYRYPHSSYLLSLLSRECCRLPPTARRRNSRRGLLLLSCCF